MILAFLFIVVKCVIFIFSQDMPYVLHSAPKLSLNLKGASDSEDGRRASEHGKKKRPTSHLYLNNKAT